MIDVIGYLGSFVGTIVMLPQIIKSIKTKSVDDVSWVMLWLYVINCALWLTYGVLMPSNPIILCNATALLIISAEIYIKIKYSK